MYRLDSVQTSNSYGTVAIIQDAFDSTGGYFVVAGADAYMQLQYGAYGFTEWTDEVHVTAGNGIINPGTVGIRFRSYVAGSPATISAGMSLPSEPPVTLLAGGIATAATTLKIAHNGALVGTEGQLDFEDATGFAWTVADDGANSQVKVTPPNRAFVQLAATTLAAPAASIDFQAIPASYFALAVILYARCDDVATTVGVNLTLNNDGAANYDFEYIQSSNAAVTGTEAFGDTGALVGLATGASAGANLFDSTVVTIPSYANATNNKTGVWQAFHKHGTAAGNLTIRSGGFAWRSNAAVNRLTLLDRSGGNFVAGTRAILGAYL